MSASLLAVLINTVALPELTTWLRELHASGTPLTDAVILQKLITDTNLGEQIGTAWLTAHPVTPVP
jgi:hypothetical protein